MTSSVDTFEDTFPSGRYDADADPALGDSELPIASPYEMCETPI